MRAIAKRLVIRMATATKCERMAIYSERIAFSVNDRDIISYD
tara:strand:+ start:660 stop:785 length:126 start_codon:yes stop_codon:yes gene_type:complete